MKKFRFLIIFTSIFFSFSVKSSTMELCNARGTLLASIATERDKGTPKRNVVDLLYKHYGKSGVKRKTIDEYASIVYSDRSVPPSGFYSIGKMSCLDEFGLIKY